MSEELKPCPLCGCNAVVDSYNNTYTVTCPNCWVEVGRFDNKEDCIKEWNNRPIEDEKDREIARLIAEIDNLQHFCDSILDMTKRNNGVLYFKQDSGTWKIETGKDTDVPANDTDNY